MKKITLLFILSVCCTSAMFAQSIKFIYKGEVCDTISLNIKEALEGSASFSFFFENTTSAEQTVTLSQKSNYPQNTRGTWCGYGDVNLNCYDVDLTSPSFHLPTGISSETRGVYFHLEYFPQGIKDTAYAVYTLKNVNNTSDSSRLVVCYYYSDAQPSAITPVGNEVALNAYPNPAKTMVNFSYILPQSQTNAKIVLRDMVGKVIKEVVLKQAKDKATISVEDLANGVYFYTLVLNDVASITKKLVVKH